MINSSELKSILREWRDGPFKRALSDPERLAAAKAMFVVALEKGDPIERVLGMVIADFVTGIIAPEDIHTR